MRLRAKTVAVVAASGIVACLFLATDAIGRSIARIEEGGGWFTQGALIALLSVTVLTQLRLLLLIGLAVRRLSTLSRLRAARSGVERSWPGVTVVMPAHNEQRNLEAGLQSLAELDYPNLELLIVDDGSRDGTLEIARDFAARQTGGPVTRTMRVITKPSGGKWAALNLGVREARHALVLGVDADSRVSSNALRALVPHLDEPEVGAACGQVRVRNRDGLLGHLQAVEYNVAGFGRAAQNDCVMVVPGPIGLFRKSALVDVTETYGTGGLDAQHPGHVPGPFSGDTFAEDFDTTQCMLALGYRVVWDPQAIAFTRAPSDYPTLLNQRYRWMRGTLQAMLKVPLAKRGARRPHPRLRAWLAGTLWPDLFLLTPLSVLSLFGLMLALAGATDFPWGVPLSILTVDVAIASLAIDVHDDDWRLLPSALLFGIFSTFYCFNWFPVMWDQLRGSKMRW